MGASRPVDIHIGHVGKNFSAHRLILEAPLTRWAERTTPSIDTGMPIHNIRRICETLAEHGARIQDPQTLVAATRVALGRTIIQRIGGPSGELPVITLEPALERLLQDSLQEDGDGGGGIEPGLAETVHSRLLETTQRQEIAGEPAVLLVSPTLRPWLSRFLRHGIPGLSVLAYNEVPENRNLRMVAAVGG